MEILEKYLVSPYKIIISKDSSDRQEYFVEVVFETSRYLSLTNSIEKKILSEKGFLDSKIVKLQPLIRYLKRSVEEKLEYHSLDISPKLRPILCDWMVYRIIGLEGIIPLLIDDRIQEIYLDRPNTAVYIDHQDFGRCITNLFLSETELDRIKTRLCLEKDVIINRLNPSLKVEVKTEQFHIRASIDIPPLASDGLSMNIRKLRRKAWTLPELVLNKMLSIEAAVYLLFVMKRRNNITIIGEPGSGKTTLANAIDLLTPSHWRKVTIEDVIESIDQTEFNKFQTRYSVSPFETKKTFGTKSEEIIKLLHRSPTWVYLGEIQTAEHSKALFEALCAGLVGIQTCHAKTIETMLIRWVHQHGIPISSILSLDVLIEVSSTFKNWKINRRVNRISEMSKNSVLGHRILETTKELEVIDIFNYDPKESRLIIKMDLFETPTIKKIRENEKISRNDFKREITLLSNLLTYLIDNHIFDPTHVIKILSSLDLESLIQNYKIPKKSARQSLENIAKREESKNIELV